MGAILKRKLKAGGFNYYIEYADEKGQRHSETIGRDYRMAKKVLADREALIARGKFSEIFARQKEGNVKYFV